MLLNVTSEIFETSKFEILSNKVQLEYFKNLFKPRFHFI